MHWLTDFYSRHPEYRRLRVAQRDAVSIHFELEPYVYQAFFQVHPMHARTVHGWLPLTDFVRVARMAKWMFAASPRAVLQFAAMLPLATVLSLQPDGAAGKDTYLVLSRPNNNGGAVNTLAFGYYGNQAASDDCLLQFDVSSIPTQATISDSVLSLTRSVSYGAYAYSYGAYMVVRAWVEGTKGDAAPADGATWNTYDGTNAWGTAGCNNTTSDRSGTAGNAHAINYAGNISFSIPAMTQVWVTTPASNKGLIILTPDAWNAQGMYVCCSSDHATPGSRPLLTVTYTLAAGGAVFNPPFSAPFRGPFG